MISQSETHLTQAIIQKDKWWDMLSRFIDVLRINLFIVDVQGRIVLPPEEKKYGGQLLTDLSLGYGLMEKILNVPKSFEQYQDCYEAINCYGLYSYALPIRLNEKVLAYLMIGPVALNRKADDDTLRSWAETNGSDPERVVDQLKEVRVISNVMVNSILNLLSEIVRDNVELSLRQYKSRQEEKTDDSLAVNIDEVAEEIYSTVRLDELLVTLLDMALKMTETEKGSIMILDDDKKTLTVKVSKGVFGEGASYPKGRVGEGIAGYAFSQRKAFVINGEKADAKIKPLLKRPEIKKSLVMPLQSQKRVFGVLNLHTEKDHDRIEDNLDNLQYLTKLLSSAF